MANVIDLSTLISAVTDELADADTVSRAEDYDQLTEGVHDTPLLQVYPDSGDLVSTGSGTDKLTFGAGDGAAPERQERVNLIADYFAAHRGHIGQGMGRLVDGIDAIRSKLKEQNNDEQPFGVSNVHSFQWRWERVTFEYGGVKYVAARFFISVQMAA